MKTKNNWIACEPIGFVGLLLDSPITIAENGVKILVPNPANFCLHKLIIASRRRNIDKSLKDLQQAICTSIIVDKQGVCKLFNSLPKKWKQSIVRMLEKSKRELPLLSKEIDELAVTLQTAEK